MFVAMPVLEHAVDIVEIGALEVVLKPVKENVWVIVQPNVVHFAQIHVQVNVRELVLQHVLQPVQQDVPKTVSIFAKEVAPVVVHAPVQVVAEVDVVTIAAEPVVDVKDAVQGVTNVIKTYICHNIIHLVIIVALGLVQRTVKEIVKDNVLVDVWLVAIYHALNHVRIFVKVVVVTHATVLAHATALVVLTLFLTTTIMEYRNL